MIYQEDTSVGSGIFKTMLPYKTTELFFVNLKSVKKMSTKQTTCHEEKEISHKIEMLIA